MAAVGKFQNADYSCQQLLDSIDALNTALGEHGCRAHLDQHDAAVEVTNAVLAYVRAQQQPAEDEQADTARLSDTFNGIFAAAKKYFDHFAPAYGPDDNAKIWKSEGEPERIDS